MKKGSADECWPWQGAKAFGGYGSLTFHGQGHRAHRAALTLVTEEHPDLDALHLCHNAVCCNPSHLMWGTHKQNMAQRLAAGRANMPTGDAHWKRRIDSKTAAAIKADLAAGRRQIDIAASYGVKRSLVADISTGRAWRTV